MSTHGSRYGYQKVTNPYQTYRKQAQPQPLTYYNYQPVGTTYQPTRYQPTKYVAPAPAPVVTPVTRTAPKEIDTAWGKYFSFKHRDLQRYFL